MIEHSIRVRYVDSSRQRITRTYSIRGLKYVEELVYRILDEEGVNPVGRSLFGLKQIVAQKNQCLWYAPNFELSKLLKSINKSPEDTLCELRLRYRPSCYTKLIVLDLKAFNLIYAQMRYDFENDKFSSKDEDVVLLRDLVVKLMVLDLSRHVSEKNIPVCEISNEKIEKEFLPKKWNKPFLFLFRERERIIKEVQRCCKEVKDDSLTMKKKFVETFLEEVPNEYSIEEYEVSCADNLSISKPMKIRTKFSRISKPDSYQCSIETVSLLGKQRRSSTESWTELTDIYKISKCHMLNEEVEIITDSGKASRFRFKSKLFAKSFVSAIDGYYRLMRSWYFNICPEVTSPDLEYLTSIKSHGPIGFETMRSKLTKLKEAGTYLIRRSMKRCNTFIVDALLTSKARIQIDIEWDCGGKKFKRLPSDGSSERAGAEVSSFDFEYSELQELISDLQIKQISTTNNWSTLQLTHCIQPGDHDQCPNLLLSISRAKLREWESEVKRDISLTIAELPKVIPQFMVSTRHLLIGRFNNKVNTFLANFNGQTQVIVKGPISQSPSSSYVQKNATYGNVYNNLNNRSHISQSSHIKTGIVGNVQELRWMFTKSDIIADTIGILIDEDSISIVQEEFPIGTLERYLHRETLVKETTRGEISKQLVQALNFIQDKCMIHGKIRCHNLMMKSIDPIQIKLSDPLGEFNIDEDRAFIPPECFIINSRLDFTHYQPGVDVWAFGTTLWQVYSNGANPPLGMYANTLLKPLQCPEQIWKIIESCWVLDPQLRSSSKHISRDIFNYVAWIKEPLDGYDNNKSYDHSPEDSPTSGTTTCSSSVSGRSSACSGSQVRLLPHKTATTNASQIQTNGCRGSTINSTPNQGPITRTWRTIFKSSPKLNTEAERDLSTVQYRNISSVSSSTDDRLSTSEIDLIETESLTSRIYPAWQINPDHLKLCSEIGRGSCGIVMKGILSHWGGPDDQVVAVKFIQSFRSDEKKELFRYADLKSEFEILKKIDHENIVKAIGFVDEDEDMKLVIEYMPMGSLLSFLRNFQQEHLLSLPLQKYALDIARGMEYLANMGIIHRDLALRNILLKNQNVAKISDFGLARLLDEGNPYSVRTKERSLPIRWYPPEVIHSMTFNRNSDIWSYGVVLWEIYSGGRNPQYVNSNLVEALKSERLVKPMYCPDDIYKLMLSCWAENPEDREPYTRIIAKLANLPDFSQDYL